MKRKRYSVERIVTAVRYLQQQYAVNERRDCRATGMSRSMQRYVSHTQSQDALRLRIRDPARSRVRYGYRRIQALLKRERIRVNKKRVYRLFCVEGLQLRARRPRRHAAAATRRLSAISYWHRTWPGAWTSSVIKRLQGRGSGH